MQKTLLPYRIQKNESAYVSVRNIAERLDANDAHNIAVTGGYGSGKSSVLYTLQMDFPKYNYLTISLATLESENKKTGFQPAKNTKEDALNQRIEYSILQQLIYRESQSTLKNSRIKRIFSITDEVAQFRTTLIICTLLALAGLWWKEAIVESMFSIGCGSPIFSVLFTSICLFELICASSVVINHIVRRTGRHSLRKVNVGSGEIELEDNTSILNKHMDEIIYFFQTTPYNVVLIEDLDRFQTTHIFLKLRELNFLLNQSKEIGRDIFFIYAVRDDIFRDDARTKFFDYITTVIPVTNHSNSYDQIVADLTERNLLVEFQQNHLGYTLDDLRDICWYVKDKRLAINIVNEYEQYKTQLKEQDAYKMLAMMVVKNYYPHVFEQLCQESGPIAEAVRLREKLIEDSIKDTNEEISMLLEQEQNSKQEQLLNELELRTIYLNEYRKKVTGFCKQIIVDGTAYLWEDVAQDETIFEMQRHTPKLSYREYDTAYHRFYDRTIDIAFQDIEASLGVDKGYEQRLTAIRNKKRDFASELAELRNRLTTISAKSLSELLSEDLKKSHKKDGGYASILSSLNLPSMIENFLRRGFIDEHYLDYVTPFCAGYLTNKDHELLMNIKVGMALGYETKIEKVQSLVAQMSAPLFRSRLALNIFILDYLYEHKDTPEIGNNYEIMLQTLKDRRTIDFQCSYFLRGLHKDDVIKELIEKQYVDYPKWHDKADDRTKESLSCMIFRYYSKELSSVSKIPWVNARFDFIAKHVDLIGWNAIKELLDSNVFEFDLLTDSNEKLCNLVISSGAYALNRSNVEFICRANNLSCDEGVNYSMLINLADMTLLKRVEKNMSFALQSIFGGKVSKQESQDAISKILNNKDISAESRCSYLSNQEKFVEVDEWPDSIDIRKAIGMQIIFPNWDNVKQIFTRLNNVWEEELLEWVNNDVLKEQDDTIPEWMRNEVVKTCAIEDCQWSEKILRCSLIDTEAEEERVRLVCALIGMPTFAVLSIPELFKYLPLPLQKVLHREKKFCVVKRSDEMDALLRRLGMLNYVTSFSPVQDDKMRVYNGKHNKRDASKK